SKAKRKPWVALGCVFMVSLLLRVVAYEMKPALHPDEIFQYLEPAWWHLHGVGWKSWEWRDGVRSWVLPSYHGGWMELLSWFGAGNGKTAHSFLQLHWAFASLAMVWAGYEAGRLMCQRFAGPKAHAVDDLEDGWQGGLLAALLVGLFPSMLYYAPHTLSE